MERASTDIGMVHSCQHVLNIKDTSQSVTEHINMAGHNNYKDGFESFTGSRVNGIIVCNSNTVNKKMKCAIFLARLDVLYSRLGAWR